MTQETGAQAGRVCLATEAGDPYQLPAIFAVGCLPAAGARTRGSCSIHLTTDLLLDSSGLPIAVGVGLLWPSSQGQWSFSLGKSPQPCQITESALSFSPLCSRVFKTDMELEVLRYTNRISSEAHREVSWAPASVGQ